MAKESGKGLYKKRYATLKEHKAAVAAQNTIKKSGHTGPVSHGGTYANSLKVKPAEKKPAPAPKASKPAPKASTPKPTAPKKPVQKPSTASDKAVKGGYTISTTKRSPAPKPEVKKHRGGGRANNNTRGRAKVSSGPKAGDTRKTRKGSSYVTQMYDGKKWVNGKVGGKG